MVLLGCIITWRGDSAVLERVGAGRGMDVLLRGLRG